MSHFLTIPINENGIILDERFKEELQTAATDPFAFTDVFLYSHGWWNTASSASAEYNIFSLGFARALQGLVCASPAQWPKIGAAFQPLALAEDGETCRKMQGNEFNVALIQAASDTDSLAPGQLYGKVQQCIPNLRMLITTSANDTALGKWYPEAQRIAHLFSGAVGAMGAKGPTGDLKIPVDQRLDVTGALVPTFTQRLGVANLTPLHQATAAAYGAAGDRGGQHSDINLPQIYDMLARFFGH